jgi:membrane fusion protein
MFRAAALHARQISTFGPIILIRPVSFAFLTLVAAIAAISILCFLVLGTYTKRVTVQGQLMPEGGLIKVYASQSGMISEKHVEEGQTVRRGDVLYVLASNRVSSTTGDVQAEISTEVLAKRNSLKDELVKTQTLEQVERQAISTQIADFESELRELASMVVSQQARVKLAQDSTVRYERAGQFVSLEQLAAKQADLLDQETHLQTVERDQISVRRQLHEQQGLLAQLPEKYSKTISEIEQNIAVINQDFSESEVKRRAVILAPESGVATATLGEVGQTVDIGRPLVSILQGDAKLQAYLYAPSKAIGFVKRGAIVQIRYQSFPYQQFGEFQGSVVSVARTALSTAELSDLRNLSLTSEPTTEPVYRIAVGLDSQFIVAYGNHQPLQSGTLVDADILLEKRRLYEWVLEPTFAISGRL